MIAMASAIDNLHPGSPVDRGTGIIDDSSADRVEQIRTDIRNLQGMDEKYLTQRGTAAFGKQVPDGLPISLLRSILVQRLQVEAFGGLDRKTAHLLDRIAEQDTQQFLHGRTEKRARSDPRTLADLGVDNDRRGRLQPGTVLVREHQGEIHHVMVMSDGFSWNGEIYSSLSKVACAITGTNWNGKRFFGLGRPKLVPGTRNSAGKTDGESKTSRGSNTPCPDKDEKPGPDGDRPDAPDHPCFEYTDPGSSFLNLYSEEAAP